MSGLGWTYSLKWYGVKVKSYVVETGGGWGAMITQEHINAMVGEDVA